MIAALLAVATHLHCPPLLGADALVSAPAVKVIWVGELHGSAEQPALFGDLVCRAALRRPVVVVLERNVSEQPAWDAFLGSDGGAAATATFLKDGGWSASMRDGRNSRAMLALARRLREDVRSGRVVAVRMMVREPNPYTAAGHEAGMAGEVQAAASAFPQALVLAYSGDVHASRIVNTHRGQSYSTAALLLGQAGLKTVEVSSGHGEAWNCQEDGCKTHPYLSDDTAPRGIVPLGGDPWGFDFVAHVGRATTASAPAVPRQAAASR